MAQTAINQDDLDVLDDDRFERLKDIELDYQALKGLFEADGELGMYEMQVGEPLDQRWAQVGDERTDLHREILEDVREAREAGDD